MGKAIRIGLVGDYDESVPAHRAIPLALDLAAKALKCEAKWEWIGTQEIVSADRLEGLTGLWCVPASPYRDMQGALRAIKWARENNIPFLGTCGGFQHAIVEYARSVLRWRDAQHGETSPAAARAVITPLECALVEKTDKIRLVPGSRMAAAYSCVEVEEGYRCRYGLNPAFRSALLSGRLQATAFDGAGEVRAVELTDHPFFVGTLFQPERQALTGKPVPLAVAFLQAMATRPSKA